MKVFSSWEGHTAGVGGYTLRADNVLSNSGKEYYQPDWIEGLEAKPMCLVRMGKVAKCVDSQFAERYYDDLTLAVSLRATELAEGLPMVMRDTFDGSLVRWGVWKGYDEIAGEDYMGYKMLSPDHVGERIELVLPSREMIALAIAELSKYYLLKVGDLIALPMCDGSWQLNRNQGVFVCDNEKSELIYFRIK